MDIQKNLKELRNDDRTALRRSKLFKREEIRKIIDIRRIHNTRIQSAPNNLACFKDYISNDESLFELIAMRRKETKSSPKEDSIEHIILKRLKLLYEVAFMQFPDESDLLVSFLKFFRKVNHMKMATITVCNLLDRFQGNVHTCWLALGKWYAYECGDKDNAMAVLLEGVKRHPENELLYIEIIKLEMTELTMYCSPTMENVNKQQLCVQRIQDAVNMALDNIYIADLYVYILRMLEPNSLTRSVQDMIIDRLIEDCPDHETVWHVLAQRERNDLYCTYDVSKIEDNKFEKKGNFPKKVDMCTTKRTPKARLEACFAKYRQGLAVTPILHRWRLWRLYIEFLLRCKKQIGGGSTVLTSETVKTVLNDACTQFSFFETDYALWLELLGNDQKEALAIVTEKGTKAAPCSLKLWKARLRLQMSIGELKDVEEVFKIGVMKLQHNTLPLWELMLQYYALSADNDKIVKLYEDGVKQPNEVSDVLKPKYLEWVILKNGIDPGRKLYMKLATQKPYCNALHKIMCKYELKDMGNFPFWERALKLACRQFGRENADVWIAYIQFYVRYKKIPDRLKRIENIYKEANNCLSKEYIYHLNSLYTQIMNELS